MKLKLKKESLKQIETVLTKLSFYIPFVPETLYSFSSTMWHKSM